MPSNYNINQTNTTEFDAWPLIPQEVSNGIIDSVAESSAALSLFSRLPNMTSKTQRMPLLDSLGDADFTGETVTDDLISGTDFELTQEEYNNIMQDPYGKAPEGYLPNDGAPGLKKIHFMKWNNVYIVNEPIAIILPVPDDVLDDSEYDLWAAMRPRIVEAFHRRIDEAAIWGMRRPRTWPSGIVPTALSRGQTVVEGTATDLAGDVSNLMGTLETIGYDPTGFIASPALKATLRNMRSSKGDPLYTQGIAGKEPDTLYGQRINYINNATFLNDKATLIAGKFDEAKFAIRQDISWKLFTEGVISDNEGRVLLNLMQQDSKAMRVVMRLGWVVPNPIHALRPDRADYPFSVMTPKTGK